MNMVKDNVEKKMIRMKHVLFLFMAWIPVCLMADNWDAIVTSEDYYFGVGHGKTEMEASEHAMAFLVEMIATHVSSEFTGLMEAETTGRETTERSRVQSCINSYAHSTLTNVGKMTRGKEPEVTVLRYMRRTELMKIYEDRIAKSKDMTLIAAESLEKGKVDMALQYYYWAYSLLRSVQRPSEVKDAEGRVLVNWLPVKIEEILSDVHVHFDRRDGDYVDLFVEVAGRPVSSLLFSYSDGRADCEGRAADGRSMIEMVPGYETDIYHVNIEYEFKGQARGDDEMQSVLAVIPKRVFRQAEKTVGAPPPPPPPFDEPPMEAHHLDGPPPPPHHAELHQQPSASQLVTDAAASAEVVEKVVEAIRSRQYSNVQRLFTLEGLEMYNQLIAYGKGRVVGQPQLQFFKSANGHVVVRGLQMSFSFNRGTKTTFVEDVIFTLNKDNKISNVAFGLGKVAEDDILCKYAPGWKDETRELIMEFMESYKTAYCLKRLDYIRNIFADDAVIIVGNVAKRRTPQLEDSNRRSISEEGLEVIHYNRYSKDQYLKNLERCFQRNEFINIRFSNNDIQWLEKYDKEELFAIQIGQEYNSTTYADKGYLFLLVDMTDHDAPQIKIRTWQPHEVAMDKLYNAGDFYNE